MITTQDLRKTYSSRRGEVEAVRGIDLSVSAGEIFGLLGPNGAGKTTTMRMLATLIPMTSGKATVAGVDLRADPAEVRRRIGYVPQGGSSDPLMTGRRELYQQGRFSGLSKTDSDRRADEIIPALQLTDVADRATKTYSGGQRRRLDIALGLVHSPRLLFLDEPTTGLDPQSRAHMWDEVRKLREGGTTILLTTHYLDEADALCDRLVIVDHGTVVAEGSPSELKRQIAGEAIVIGSIDPIAVETKLRELPGLREITHSDDEVRAYVDDAATSLPTALRLLDAAGLSITTASVTKPSLDDVFLRQTGRSLRETSA
ncbi:MAG: ATP-binding cassette domain-containing protein [Jatrophihabitans sp.]